MRTVSSSAASPRTPVCLRPLTMWPNSRAACCTPVDQSFAPKPFPSSPGANPCRSAHLALWAGTLPLRLRNPVNIFLLNLLVISATPELLSGSIPSANFPSRCSPTAPGPTARIKPSGKSAQNFTMPSACRLEPSSACQVHCAVCASR